MAPVDVPSTLWPSSRGLIKESIEMMVVGIVLLLLGLVLSIPILWTIGIVVLLVGLVLLLLGSLGHAVGGRRHYY